MCTNCVSWWIGFKKISNFWPGIQRNFGIVKEQPPITMPASTDEEIIVDSSPLPASTSDDDASVPDETIAVSGPSTSKERTLIQCRIKA